MTNKIKDEIIELSKQNKIKDFTDEQVDWLIDHLGSLDAEERDKLSYGLMAQGFLDNLFTFEQKSKVIEQISNNDMLFAGIGSEDDLVFQRSFTALIGALILVDDATNKTLNQGEREKWFTDSYEYLRKEIDWRGFVPKKGWAHAVAHGADLMSSAVSHPDFKADEEILETILSVIGSVTKPLVDDEEDRLAMVVVSLVQAGRLKESSIIASFKKFDEQLWDLFDSSQNFYYYRLSFWKSFLFSVSILVPSLDTSVKLLITNYYQQFGYLD